MTNETTFACSVKGHVNFKMKIFWHLMLYSFIDAYQYFGETWCCQIQGERLKKKDHMSYFGRL
jgi:hypothetical protein